MLTNRERAHCFWEKVVKTVRETGWFLYEEKHFLTDNLFNYVSVYYVCSFQ
jgi:hypothetical protein